MSIHFDQDLVDAAFTLTMCILIAIVFIRSETKGMERELKGMERTILISNDIRPFNFQAVKTAITSLQIPLTPKKIINS